jgi:hypothetical protein
MQKHFNSPFQEEKMNPFLQIMKSSSQGRFCARKYGEALVFDKSGGPVIVESDDGITKIIAAIRLQGFKDGVLNNYSETMGIPIDFLSPKYYFPVYENKWPPLSSQVRFGLP